MAICAECIYLDISDGNNEGAFLCKEKTDRYLSTVIECGSFCRAYNRNSSSINNAIEFSNSHNSGSGCYLTTMLCSILKMPDNNIYLETIRSFRNNILQKDDRYKRILIEYDIVGPKIAKALSNDPLRYRIAKIFFENDIVTITKLIENKEYSNAINAYLKMSIKLKNFYGVNNYEVTLDEINNADIEKSGHGRYVQKKITL